MTAANVLSREVRIVLLSAGGQANEDAIRELWNEEISPLKLQYLAQWERATIVLWRILRRMDGLLSGYEGALDLEKAAKVWEFKLLHLESRLMQIADLLEAADIPMMPLKGSGLAYTVHEGFTARPMNDLDILVPPDRAMEAWQLLQEKKWHWDAAVFPLEKYSLHHHLPPLKDASGSGVRAEIHTDLCLPGSPFNLPAAGAWESARTVEAKGRRLVVPSLTHQALYTCIHFAWMHAMQDKAWISFLDIAAYVRGGEIDWPDFIEFAKTTRADTCAYWTLRLARSLSAIPVPEDVLTALKPPFPEPVLSRLERHYATTMFPTDQHCPSVWLNDRLFQAGIRRGKHVVEMHEFEAAKSGNDDRAATPGIWELVRNHLAGWRKWAHYCRLVVVGGKA